MARKRKAKAATAPRRRRSRVSVRKAAAAPRRRRTGGGGGSNIKDLLIDSATLGAGAMIASFVAGKLPLSPKVKAVAPLLLGIGLTAFGKSNPMVKKLGQGMMVGGVLSTTKSFVPSLGLAGDELSGDDQMLLGAIEMYKQDQASVPMIAPTSQKLMGDEFAGEGEMSGWVVN